MENSEITLNDLSAHEKFVLNLIGDKPREKHMGLSSTTPNYLMSIQLVNYCGGGRYELTDHGQNLYLESINAFNKNTLKEVQLITN